MSLACDDFSPPTKRTTYESPPLDEVNAITRAAINAQLRNALAHRFQIAWIAERESTNMDVNAGFGSAVSKPREPVRVVGGLAYFEHVSIVFHGIRSWGGWLFDTSGRTG